MHLHTICSEATRDYPEKTAIQCLSQALSYRELTSLADRLAQHWSAKGLRAGDRVALWLPNCPEALIAYLACFRAGLIAVALDFRYQLEEAAYCLNRSEAAALITRLDKWIALKAAHSPISVREFLAVGESVRLEDQLVQSTQTQVVRPDDVDYLSTVFFTSGTTSRPKGVTHTSRRTVSRIDKFVEEACLTRDSVSLIAISLMKPLAFQLLAMSIFRVGGTAVLLPQFSPEAFWNQYLAPPRKSLLALTPNLLAGVLEHPLAARARSQGPALWLVGGDRTPAQLHAAFQEVVGSELVELCGMTETGPYAMNPPFGPKRVGSVGVAPIGVLLRIVDAQENDVLSGEIGQLVVRTPDTMVGYWNDTLATYEVLRDGWVRTGDLARADMEGYVWLEGRLHEMIVRDGSNIAPAEIERVALSEPGISAAAAIGIEDPPHGEAVHLFITGPGPDQVKISQALAQRLRGKLRELAVPEKIHWIAELPRNAGGKVDRVRLRQYLP
jgi:long-chain acyl-CoA synthetase